jgi:hypothetical protein
MPAERPIQIEGMSRRTFLTVATGAFTSLVLLGACDNDVPSKAITTRSEELDTDGSSVTEYTIDIKELERRGYGEDEIQRIEKVQKELCPEDRFERDENRATWSSLKKPESGKGVETSVDNLYLRCRDKSLPLSKSRFPKGK